MFRKVIFFTCVVALIVIGLDAHIRITGTTMACPDWPGCYGQWMITDTQTFYQRAQENFPGGLPNLYQVWKELIFRYATFLLASLSGLILLFSWTQKQYRVVAIFGALVLLMLSGLQLAFSQWVVEYKAMPLIESGQYLVTCLTLWFGFWFYLRLDPKLNAETHVVGRKKYWLNYLGLKKDIGQESVQSPSGPSGMALFAIIVLFIQVALGIWTSTNNAALVCGGFPKCNNVWWPNADFARAFDVFAGLVNQYSGILAYKAQIAVHWVHRLSAIVVFLILTIVMLRATTESCPKSVRRSGVILSVLLLVDLLLGIYIIKLELPVIIAVSHGVMSALLMLPLISIRFYSRYALVPPVDIVSEEETEELVVEEKTALEHDVTPVINETVAVPVETQEPVYQPPSKESLYLRLKNQLSKTRSGMGGIFSALSLGQRSISDELIEEIEASLIMADLGIEATTEIITQLSDQLERHELQDAARLEGTLKTILLDILQPCSQPLVIPEQEGPFVILVVGINGVGKTTTIGKMAKRLQLQGHSVMLAAGDTFRAAAVEQLQTWGERNNIHVVAQHTGADSASVIFDGVQSAKAKGVDVLIADTAGRLHTKSNLMDELSKIRRIMGKIDPTAPHEVLLVLDAGTGQNALSQTKIFNESVNLSGLALTKLDGTAKGGVIFALARQFGLPIRYIGVGEGIDDLQDFDAHAFVDALFVRD